MKIGLLGGSFDPPHRGHLALALAAMEQLELNEVVFVPANRNPLKTRAVSATGKQRMSMVAAMIADQPTMSVSDMELTRGGPSYAIETLQELQMVHPGDYWFLMGADTLRGFDDWKNPLRLLKIARLGVVLRPPLGESDVLSRLNPEVEERVDLIRMPADEVSSSEVRTRLENGQSIASWLPDAVFHYIKSNKLYRN